MTTAPRPACAGSRVSGRGSGRLTDSAYAPGGGRRARSGLPFSAVATGGFAAAPGAHRLPGPARRHHHAKRQGR